MPDPLLRSSELAPGLLSQLPFLLAMVAIFYFLVWRPQRQEQEEQEKQVAAIQKGDRVVTQAGIHGTVLEAAGDTLILEISRNCQLTVDRASVKRRTPAGAPAGAAGAPAGAANAPAPTPTLTKS